MLMTLVTILTASTVSFAGGRTEFKCHGAAKGNPVRPLSKIALTIGRGDEPFEFPFHYRGPGITGDAREVRGVFRTEAINPGEKTRLLYANHAFAHRIEVVIAGEPSKDPLGRRPFRARLGYREGKSVAYDTVLDCVPRP